MIDTTLSSISPLFPITVLAIASTFACTTPGTESSSSVSDKIVGGTVAADGAWTGAAALIQGSSFQVCGGTLVAPQWVVSAGHCVIDETKVNGGIDHIVLGRNKLSDTTKGESIKVVKAILHEGFDAHTLVNDISLFQLQTPAHSPVAKLVDPTEAIAAVVPDATTTTVGWGALHEGDHQGSDVLMQVAVPIIPNDTCKALPDPQYGNITEGSICAGFLQTGGHDSCQGDSGGPLFMKINGQIRHVGLVSWGIGCAEANNPGVYTRTTTHLAWLKQHSNGDIVSSLTTAE
jgi:secreted trypsin-like serine protease